jgi:hypothetical protein
MAFLPSTTSSRGRGWHFLPLEPAQRVAPADGSFPWRWRGPPLSRARFSMTCVCPRRLSTQCGPAVRRRLVLTRRKPGIAADQNEFSPSGWDPQMFFDSRSIRFGQLPDDRRNTAALARPGKFISTFYRRSLRHRLRHSARVRLRRTAIFHPSQLRSRRRARSGNDHNGWKADLELPPVKGGTSRCHSRLGTCERQHREDT